MDLIVWTAETLASNRSIANGYLHISSRVFNDRGFFEAAEEEENVNRSKLYTLQRCSDSLSSLHRQLPTSSTSMAKCCTTSTSATSTSQPMGLSNQRTSTWFASLSVDSCQRTTSPALERTGKGYIPKLSSQMVSPRVWVGIRPTMWHVAASVIRFDLSSASRLTGASTSVYSVAKSVAGSTRLAKHHHNLSYMCNIHSHSVSSTSI
jgi:hypothetical protein